MSRNIAVTLVLAVICSFLTWLFTYDYMADQKIKVCSQERVVDGSIESTLAKAECDGHLTFDIDGEGLVRWFGVSVPKNGYLVRIDDRVDDYNVVFTRKVCVELKDDRDVYYWQPTGKLCE